MAAIEMSGLQRVNRFGCGLFFFFNKYYAEIK